MPPEVLINFPGACHFITIMSALSTHHRDTNTAYRVTMVPQNTENVLKTTPSLQKSSKFCNDGNVPPRRFELRPSEPESEILSIKL